MKDIATFFDGFRRFHEQYRNEDQNRFDRTATANPSENRA